MPGNHGQRGDAIKARSYIAWPCRYEDVRSVTPTPSSGRPHQSNGAAASVTRMTIAARPEYTRVNATRSTSDPAAIRAVLHSFISPENVIAKEQNRNRT